MIPVDNSSNFGYYKPNIIVKIIITITRSIGKNWFSKRIIFFLRKIAIILSEDCIDTELFNSKLRLYTKGNVSEKRALFSPQIFEKDERDFIANMSKDNSIFIDIGSNIGLYSFSVGNIYKTFKNTKIFSIEPNPFLFERLKYNVSQNMDVPIFPREIAIMDKSGKFKLDTPNENLGQGKISDTGKHSVIAKSLIDFINDEKIKNISAIKIDVEGNEENVIIPFIDKVEKNLLPSIIIIENNYNSWKIDLINKLSEKGYLIKNKTRMNYILELTI
ncbi:MAG: FkbM family methyltransferase [Rhizobiales bacterium TMED168]|nr:MAG: FkbM family methyltransferase [Rhizobiales bacterium TMED168]|tara:strand:- start:29483 stop:30307 length:825 start_codon:yes stop_codon:yes gene_type:complete